jgi:23S rRNA (cytidine1920-2'-O)/16S rRNA (cytidine1409-2'-O)-methyltransferase
MVSRAGPKLIAALDAFDFLVEGKVCADFGCNVGGFTQVLVDRGASKVFAIDTGYGQLDYNLRKHPRVVAMERTNAMHVSLPQPIDLVVIDVAWTRQKHILPAAKQVLAPSGRIVSLIKPHYEAQKHQLEQGVLIAGEIPTVLQGVRTDIASCELAVVAEIQSPVVGTGGNTEFLFLLKLDDKNAEVR